MSPPRTRLSLKRGVDTLNAANELVVDLTEELEYEEWVGKRAKRTLVDLTGCEEGEKEEAVAPHAAAPVMAIDEEPSAAEVAEAAAAMEEDFFLDFEVDTPFDLNDFLDLLNNA